MTLHCKTDLLPILAGLSAFTAVSSCRQEAGPSVVSTTPIDTRMDAQAPATIPPSRREQLIADLRNIDHGFDDVDRAVAAIDAIEREADESWLPELRTMLVTGGNFFVREGVAPAVIRLDGVNALPLLIQAQRLGTSENHDNDGLDAYIIGLIERHPNEAVRMIHPWLTDTDPAFRASAAWLLGYLARASLLVDIEHLARDNDPRVRSNALGALPNFPQREEVFRILTAALADPDESVRVSAVSSLGYFGDTRAIGELERLRPTTSDRLRGFIDDSVERIQHPEKPFTKEQLEELFVGHMAALVGHDEDAQVRAAISLRHCNNLRALPELMRLRVSASGRLRYFIDSAIERLQAHAAKPH